MNYANKNMNMKNYINYIYLLVFSLLIGLSSCIKNDIPYPVIELYINNIYGEGFTTKSVDYSSQKITLELEEQTNIRKVEVDSVSYTESAIWSESIVGTLDLYSPIEVTLSLYQDYLWEIAAEQPIERYFKVDGQIGDEVIDVENKTATAYVSESTDRDNIVIKSLKLGPADVTTTLTDISSLNQFITYRNVMIEYHDVNETWRLYVEHTDVKVQFTMCEAWATKAWLTAAGETSEDCGFRYRKTGNSDWIEIPQSNVVVGDGTFSAEYSGLESNTSYEFLAYSGENVTEVETKVSDALVLLENGGFEEWSKPSKSWFPYSDDLYQFWSTGNEGATTLGESYNLTTPEYSDLRPGTSGLISASLQSRNVLVKFAAGNLFVGKYISTDGTNGIVGFGQSFTSRPTALKGWVKYSGGIMDCVGTIPPGVDIVKNETKDVGMIYIALGDWTPEEYGINPANGTMVGTESTPLVVHTKYSETFFDPDGDNVIAYGELVFNEDQEEWLEFTIPLIYNDMTRIPTNMTIVCSASRYGDYFTGSSNSYMMLDDFELIYE